jgi:hypothetical protein
MKKEEAKKYVASLEMTDADKRSFETFQSIHDAMTKFKESGVTVLTVNSEQRTINERDLTEFHLAPEDSEETPFKMILAYNSNNIYADGESLRKLGEKDIDKAVAILGAFKVTETELTGEFPMRRSRAAEALGFTPEKEMTGADWTKLRKKYESAPDLREAAESAVYDARPIFNIPKIHIEAVD